MYLGESISLFVKIQNDCPNTNIYGLHFNIELHSPKYNNNLLVDGPFDCLSSSSSIHRILYHEINDLGLLIIEFILYITLLEFFNIRKLSIYFVHCVTHLTRNAGNVNNLMCDLRGL